MSPQQTSHPLHAGLAALLLLTAPAVWAADADPAMGERTRAWMELQKAQEPRGDESISGEQATQIHQRHLRSFGRDIPEELRRESGADSGNSQ